MPRITLADLTAEATTIDLFDHSYRVNAITRSVQKKLEKVQPVLDGVKDEEDSDKAVAAIVDVLDALLTPENDAPAAKRALSDAWKGDKIGLGQINALFEAVQEASVARPT